jgi:hypothetical protein
MNFFGVFHEFNIKIEGSLSSHVSQSRFPFLPHASLFLPFSPLPPGDKKYTAKLHNSKSPKIPLEINKTTEARRERFRDKDEVDASLAIAWSKGFFASYSGLP